jgi:hypothetical protein
LRRFFVIALASRNIFRFSRELICRKQRCLHEKSFIIRDRCYDF